jgi:hypothetical protein
MPVVVVAVLIADHRVQQTSAVLVELAAAAMVGRWMQPVVRVLLLPEQRIVAGVVAVVVLMMGSQSTEPLAVPVLSLSVTPTRSKTSRSAQV